jgi:hypothetical protein
VSYAVLAHRGDADAELLARELAARAPGTALIWEDELFLGSRFTHRLGDGDIRTEIVLAGGRRLDSAALRGLVCRLTHTLPAQFAAAPGPDRDYAAMESHALLLSWLASLRCPVVNPASPRQLGGPALGLLEWFPLAAASGLRSRRIRLLPSGAPPPGSGWQAVAADLGSASTAAPIGAESGYAEAGAQLWAEPIEGAVAQLLVVGDRVLGGDGGEVAEGCVELARRAACPVLGVHLAAAPDDGPRVFCGAETMPRLGPEGAVAVAELLTGDAR